MLTQLEKDEVFNRMKELFSDIPYFSEVEPKLLLAINECDKIELSFANVKNFARRFYETGRYETEDEKKKWREIQWIFATCCVLIVSYQERAKVLFWDSVDKLSNAYPMFAKLADKDELDLLLKFRNMLVAATLVLNPRLNKELIIYVAGRLEGTQRRYITGKGQRDAVSMRVKIYEQEGQIVPEVRPYRSNPEKLNEKRGQSPSEANKPKKKRLEFQQKNALLPPNTSNMSGARPLLGEAKLPTMDMGLIGGQSAGLPPQYLLSSGSVLSVFDRESAIRNAAYNSLTPNNTSHIYHSGQNSSDLSDLTTDSMLDRRALQQGLFHLGGIKREGQGHSRAQLEMLLASAESVSHNSMGANSYLNPTDNRPFPSLNLTSSSLPSYMLESLPSLSSSLLSRGPLSHTSLHTFPSRMPPMSCPTDVLLDHESHNRPSYSHEWASHPFVDIPSNPADPMHPYRTTSTQQYTALGGFDDVGSVDQRERNSYSSGLTSNDTISTGPRSGPEIVRPTADHGLGTNTRQVYHSGLDALASLASKLSESAADGLTPV